MSNSNNNNKYPDSDEESVEYIYNEAGETSNTNDTSNTSATNNTPTNPIRQDFNFGGSTTPAAFDVGTTQGTFGTPSFRFTPAKFNATPSPFSAPGLGTPLAQGTFGTAFGATPSPLGATHTPFSFTPPGYGFAATSLGATHQGFGIRTNNQTDTSQTTGCNLRPPPCVNPHHTNNPSDIHNVKSAKQNTIDDLYKKLANVRAQIQNLNKTIDDIYEIIPKIN